MEKQDKGLKEEKKLVKCNGVAFRMWLAKMEVGRVAIADKIGVGRLSIINACRGLNIRKSTYDKIEAYVGKGNI